MGLIDVWADPVSAETFRTDYLGRRSLHRPASSAALESVVGVRTWTVPELLQPERARELLDVLAGVGFLRAAG